MQNFATRAQAEAAFITPDIQTIWVESYAVAGDGGGSTWTRSTSTLGQFESADGTSWRYAAQGGVINAAAFGAIANGEDEAGFLSQAIGYFNTSITGQLYIPGGDHLCNSGLVTITRSGRIYGDGPVATQLICTTAIDVLIVGTTQPVIIENLGIVYVSPIKASVGRLIRLGTENVQNIGSTLRDVQVANGWINIDAERAAFVTYIGCSGANPAHANVVIDNTAVPDAGDSMMIGCHWVDDGTTSGNVGILWQGSGGLKFSATKVLSHTYGVLIELRQKVNTSDILLHGVSIENQSTACIGITHAGDMGTLGNVQIGGAQLYNAPTLIKVFGSRVFLNGLAIAGDLSLVGRPTPMSGTPALTPGIMIDIDWVDGLDIDLSGAIVAPSGTTDTLLHVGSHVVNGRVKPYAGTGYFTSYRYVNDASTQCVFEPVAQQATVSITTGNSVFGSGPFYVAAGGYNWALPLNPNFPLSLMASISGPAMLGGIAAAHGAPVNSGTAWVGAEVFAYGLLAGKELKVDCIVSGVPW